MKDYKNFTITVLAIIILSFTTYWQYRTFRDTPFEFQLPDLKVPEFDIGTEQQEAVAKEFISPDNRLKLTYSSQWTELPKEQLEQFTDQAVKENSTVLFSGQRFDLKKSSFAFLLVQELTLGTATSSPDDPEEIIEIMKKETEDKKGEMEITYATGTDKQMLFDAKYTKGAVVLFRSKEKIIIDEKKYLISFIASAKDWSDYEPEAQQILDSVQIMN